MFPLLQDRFGHFPEKEKKTPPLREQRFPPQTLNGVLRSTCHLIRRLISPLPLGVMGRTVFPSFFSDHTKRFAWLFFLPSPPLPPFFFLPGRPLWKHGPEACTGRSPFFFFSPPPLGRGGFFFFPFFCGQERGSVSPFPPFSRAANHFPSLPPPMERVLGSKSTFFSCLLFFFPFFFFPLFERAKLYPWIDLGRGNVGAFRYPPFPPPPRLILHGLFPFSLLAPLKLGRPTSFPFFFFFSPMREKSRSCFTHGLALRLSPFFV